MNQSPLLLLPQPTYYHHQGLLNPPPKYTSDPFSCLHHHLPGPNPSLWQWPLTGPLTPYVLCSTRQPEEPFYSLNSATSFSFPPITLSKHLALKLAQDPDFLCRCTKRPHLPNLKTTRSLFLFSREPWRRQCTHSRWDGA